MPRDAFGPDGSVGASIERHEVSSGLLYTWRRQAMSGELAGTPGPPLPCFAEVRVVNSAPSAAHVTPSPVPVPRCRAAWRSSCRRGFG